MGILRSVGRSVVKPYVRLSQDMTKSLEGIRQSANDIKEITKNAEVRRKDSYIYTDSDDPRTGFEALYEKNNWDPEQLEKQRKTMTRMKWAFLVISWLGICSLIVVCYLTIGHPWSFLFASCGSLIVTGSSAIRAVQYSLYQTQIDERALIKLKDYWGRKDFWSRLFA